MPCVSKRYSNFVVYTNCIYDPEASSRLATPAELRVTVTVKSIKKNSKYSTDTIPKMTCKKLVHNRISSTKILFSVLRIRMCYDAN